MTTPGTLARGFVVGAGAQGRVTLEAWREQHPDRGFAFLDDAESLWGTEILGVQVLAGIAQLASEVGEAVLALGSNPLRRALAVRLGDSVHWAQVVHPSAVVSPTAQIGAGAVILRGAILNTQARVGAHAIVNTGAIVEHDCTLGDFSSISPGVRMGGRVSIGDGAFLATGVTVAPRVRIGAGSIIGAGSVVVRDVPDGVLAFGVPARAVRDLGRDFNWARLL